MKSLFDKFGGTYRKENDYVIPNLEMPDIENFEIGIYGQQANEIIFAELIYN